MKQFFANCFFDVSICPLHLAARPNHQKKMVHRLVFPTTRCQPKKMVIQQDQYPPSRPSRKETRPFLFFPLRWVFRVLIRIEKDEKEQGGEKRVN
jgi:hypothetical protein